MTKAQFLTKLRYGISSLSQNDIKRWTDYYSEMIDDRIEDGMSEEDSVLAMGNIDDIIAQILRDEGVLNPNENESKKDKTTLWGKIRNLWNKYVNDENRIWVILVLILAVPLWVPVVAGLIGVVVGVVVGIAGGLLGGTVALFAGVVSVAAAVYGTSIAMFVNSVMCIIKGIVIISTGGVVAESILFFGLACVFMGISILIFVLANVCVKLIIKGIKFTVSFIKTKLPKKEAEQ